MIVISERVRALPVILPPLRDELLSSWIGRHAAVYGVSSGHMLRHGNVRASATSVDLSLAPRDRLRLAELFRCDPSTIRRMTHYRRGAPARGLIATARTPHRCRRCHRGHRAHSLTRGARLRSWTEGWRLHCPVCGSDLEDVGRGPGSVTSGATSPVAERVRAQGRQGEDLLDRHLGRKGDRGPLLIELMRVLLLPRHRTRTDKRSTTPIPRLLNVIVPGFDEDAEAQHPGFRLPAALLLPLSIRGPLLAGLHRAAVQPERWIESLLGAATRPTQRRVWNCLSALCDVSASQLGVAAGRAGASPRRSQINGSTGRYVIPFST